MITETNTRAETLPKDNNDDDVEIIDDSQSDPAPIKPLRVQSRTGKRQNALKDSKAKIGPDFDEDMKIK